MKKILLSAWTALITLAILIGVRVESPNFVESVRLRWFDTMITSKEVKISEQIAIVNIDDASIKKYGQFPFPRGEYASIIQNLYSHGAGLVVFNIYMPDSDRFGQDVTLANTLKKYPVVLPQMGGTEKSKYEAFRPGVSVIGEEATKLTVDYPAIEPNIQLFNNAAKGIGVANVFPEIDGVVRRVPMVISSDGRLYPSISLETLRVAAGDPSFQIKSGETGIQALRIPSFGKITTDQIGRIWNDWSRQQEQYSLVDLPKDFGNKIVIVGLTAKGLNNPLATARGEVYPHGMQASVLDTVLSGTNISRPDWADGAEILGTALICLIALFFTRYTHGYISIIVIGVGSYFGIHYIFDGYSYLIDYTWPICTIVLCFTHGYIVKFVSEWYQKQQIKKQFGTYLSPALVAKLQENPELLRLGGESKELSIMFTDVRGFTTISEHYGEDVQGLTMIMNRYMTAMTAAIIENNGTLDKYIGDAQMAFWNAPLDEPNHAKQAVKTAIQMLESLKNFNEEIAKEGVPAFGMGLGINTGTVVVGNMGSDQRFDYTCLGDSVNLASRLEGQSKPYGVQIILGPLTAEQVKDEYDVVELDCIAVKGKKVGVKIYTLGQAATQEQFLDAYYDGRWVEAIEIAEDAIKNDSPLTKYYTAMVERMREGKPDNWDGTYHATSK
jgi:adenylate cyclase